MRSDLKMCYERLEDQRKDLIALQESIKEKVFNHRKSLDEYSKMIVEEIMTQKDEIILANEQLLEVKVNSIGKELEKIEAWQSQIKETDSKMIEGSSESTLVDIDVEFVKKTIKEVSNYTIQQADKEVEKMDIDECIFIPQNMCKHFLFE